MSVPDFLCFQICILHGLKWQTLNLFVKCAFTKEEISHCLIRHKNEPNGFIAYCTKTNCMYSTRSWNTYKIHCRRKHPNIPISELVNVSLRHPDLDQEVIEEEDEIDPNESIYIGGEIHQHKRSYLMMLAKYYLSLVTGHKLNKASCDTIANSTR